MTSGDEDFKVPSLDPQPEEDSSTRIASHFIAGLIAGVSSRTITAPLERLKILSQIHGKTFYPISGIKMMIKEGGIQSMWRGNGISILKVGPEISSKFLVYNEMKKHLSARNDGSEPTTSQRIISGFFAGAVSHSLVHPMDVCKTRLALRKTGEEGRCSMLAKNGYKNSGWRFFFKGYKTSILGISIFSCIDFATYEKLKSILCRSNVNTSGLILLCGVCSSLVAIITCYPFGVVGVYLQATDEKFSYANTKAFLTKRGFPGMYRGILSAVMKGVPTFALTYVTYEYILDFLGHKMI